MLETEQEETKERERVKLKKKEDERLKKYEQQLNEWLFGVTGQIVDMYTQACTHLIHDSHANTLRTRLMNNDSPGGMRRQWKQKLSHTEFSATWKIQGV